MVAPAGPSGVVIITGRFGSGKTEVAISYALSLARQASGVTLVDLDVVTPYFRSRESDEEMRRHGVDVIAPSAIGRYLDTPAITPQLLGAIQRADRHTILDVGGDRQGARVLGSFHAAICERGYEMLFVANPYRPFTGTAEGLAKSVAEIEASSRLKVSALVSNPNLIHETDLGMIKAGHSRIEEFAAKLGLPVAFVCVERRWVDALGSNHFAQPLLILDRFFVRHWET